MKTKNIELCKFSELPEEAKKKVMDRMREYSVEGDWWWVTYCDLEDLGLKCNGFDIGRRSYCYLSFEISAEEVAQNIINNPEEQCDTWKLASDYLEERADLFADYMDEKSEDYESPELEEILMSLDEEFLQHLSEEYLLFLRSEYEYLTSDEHVMNIIEENDYRFAINGTEEEDLK